MASTTCACSSKTICAFSNSSIDLQRAANPAALLTQRLKRHMQFSESWLRTLVDPALTTTELAHLLTMSGLEVEACEPVAPAFSGVVVGVVRAVEKHPNTDRLTVCKVDVGSGSLLDIVCGAPNVAAGMKAPCAVVGAALP